MSEISNKKQWKRIKNSTISGDKLWTLSEMKNREKYRVVRVFNVEYSGLENGIHIYVCDNAPKDILNMVKDNINDDTHVYLGVKNQEKYSREVYLWMY